jgi:hypothetical protein
MEEKKAGGFRLQTSGNAECEVWQESLRPDFEPEA